MTTLTGMSVAAPSIMIRRMNARRRLLGVALLPGLRDGMRTLLTALVVAALLGGCVSTRGKTLYEKSGVSADQKKRDEAQCVQAALDTAGARAAAPLAVDRDAVDNCIRARGYTVTAPK